MVQRYSAPFPKERIKKVIGKVLDERIKDKFERNVYLEIDLKLTRQWRRGNDRLSSFEFYFSDFGAQIARDKIDNVTDYELREGNKLFCNYMFLANKGKRNAIMYLETKTYKLQMTYTIFWRNSQS